jgi:hypothetical protein
LRSDCEFYSSSHVRKWNFRRYRNIRFVSSFEAVHHSPNQITHMIVGQHKHTTLLLLSRAATHYLDIKRVDTEPPRSNFQHISTLTKPSATLTNDNAIRHHHQTTETKYPTPTATTTQLLHHGRPQQPNLQLRPQQHNRPRRRQSERTIKSPRRLPHRRLPFSCSSPLQRLERGQNRVVKLQRDNPATVAQCLD